MSIRVRNLKTNKEERLKFSKCMEIKELRSLIEEKFSVPPALQRLFFSGKVIEDEGAKGEALTLYDYSIQVDTVIQLMAREPLSQSNTTNSNNTTPASVKGVEPARPTDSVLASLKEEEDPETALGSYEVGDYVDARDPESGAWFEGQIKRVERDENNQPQYYVTFLTYEQEGETKLSKERIRSLKKRRVELEDLETGHSVLVNYNFENAAERGFWYDAVVSGIKITSVAKSLLCTISVGGKVNSSCQILFVNEVYKVEAGQVAEASAETAVCDSCNSQPNRKCKKCGCVKCGGKDEPNTIIMCDECDDGYHLRCLGLSSLPEADDWYCHLCENKNDIIGGSGKKMEGKAKKSTNRDWGRGYATAGRSSECTIVDKHHFGPIPGIEVGMSWKLRLQVSAAGVHRPPVGGIAGTEKVGCQSIVLSGGYEDDTDNGDTFYYTGSGGRDLSGNKRTAEQSSDQKLERTNAAIARNCKAPLNKKSGGDAGDKWREGKPIRVCRGEKLAKHSDYAPEEGIRYDGIYKVRRYWPEKGKAGFIVWRYFLQRDDPSPAPWTQEGKEIIEREGFTCIYPDGYDKEKGKKRKGDEEDSEEEEEPETKKAKKPYQVSKEWLQHIQTDLANKKLWDQVMETELFSRKEFLDKVEEIFSCFICQDILNKPVTLPCSHNLCLDCLKRGFQVSDSSKCPSCRFELPEKYSMPLNEELRAMLNLLYPGYEKQQ